MSYSSYVDFAYGLILPVEERYIKAVANLDPNLKFDEADDDWDFYLLDRLNLSHIGLGVEGYSSEASESDGEVFFVFAEDDSHVALDMTESFPAGFGVVSKPSAGPQESLHDLYETLREIDPDLHGPDTIQWASFI